jgi:hypothetical protein
MSLSPKEPIYVIEDEGFTCKEFAMSVGLLAEAYGGDYWVEYWNAYNWCVFEYPE